MNIYSILIECDPNNSLGGSCYRDLYNISNYLSKESINCKKIFILTNNYINKDKYPKKCKFNIISNIKTQLNDIISEIPNNSKLLIYITGHGYQKYDKNKDEKGFIKQYFQRRHKILVNGITSFRNDLAYLNKTKNDELFEIYSVEVPVDISDVKHFGYEICFYYYM